MKDLRLSDRIVHKNIVRFVPSANKAATLQTGLCMNVSKNGIALMVSSIPDQNENLELYIPISPQILVPAIGKNVWIDLETEWGDHPYWVKAGYNLEFKSPQDEEKFTQAFAQLGGTWKTPKAKPRIEYVF